MKIDQILTKPVLTEKGINLAKNNVYCFYVNPKASKKQIKEAIEYLYNVKVNQIKTAVKKGKTKRVGKLRKEKKLGRLKIAFVKLRQGQIKLFPTS